MVDGGLPASEQLERVASQLGVPLARLKLVHRGKVLSDAEGFAASVRPGELFQAIGEAAESAEGLREADVKHLEQKLDIDRDTAIRALRRCNGDVVDALLYQLNR